MLWKKLIISKCECVGRRSDNKISIISFLSRAPARSQCDYLSHLHQPTCPTTCFAQRHPFALHTQVHHHSTVLVISQSRALFFSEGCPFGTPVASPSQSGTLHAKQLVCGGKELHPLFALHTQLKSRKKQANKQARTKQASSTTDHTPISQAAATSAQQIYTYISNPRCCTTSR